MFNIEDLQKINKRQDLINIAHKKGLNTKKVLRNLRYEEELRQLQAELVNFQQWVVKKNLRVAILFEGRDAAGKGGSIKKVYRASQSALHAGSSIGQTYGSRTRSMVL